MAVTTGEIASRNFPICTYVGIRPNAHASKRTAPKTSIKTAIGRNILRINTPQSPLRRCLPEAYPMIRATSMSANHARAFPQPAPWAALGEQADHGAPLVSTQGWAGTVGP